MKCQDLMKTELQWVPGTATVLEASRLMRDRSLGFLFVSNPVPDREVGVVTDRDLAVRACAEGLDPKEARVGDVASLNLVTCVAHEDLSVAEARMGAAQKSRLVIVNDDGKIIGLLSLTDLLRGDRGGRAVKTANTVLAREAGAPHAPLESIHLTPSTPEDEEAALNRQTVMLGGNHGGSTREFPR
jgi:CBS domain-containing protein